MCHPQIRCEQRRKKPVCSRKCCDTPSVPSVTCWAEFPILMTASEACVFLLIDLQRKAVKYMLTGRDFPVSKVVVDMEPSQVSSICEGLKLHHMTLLI